MRLILSYLLLSLLELTYVLYRRGAGGSCPPGLHHGASVQRHDQRRRHAPHLPHLQGDHLTTTIYFLIKPPATSSPSSTSCWPSSPTARASSCSGWWRWSPPHPSPSTAPLQRRGTRRGWRRRWRGGGTPGAGGGRCLFRGDHMN